MGQLKISGKLTLLIFNVCSICEKGTTVTLSAVVLSTTIWYASTSISALNSDSVLSGPET